MWIGRDSDPKMQAYHDKEWGHPEHDEQKLFELMSLELMQAGLSWQTVFEQAASFARSLL